MAQRICPKCTSWRVQSVKTRSFGDRLLQMVRLNRYRCRDCGWNGLARAKEQRKLIKILVDHSVWKKCLWGFSALVGLIVLLNVLSITMAKRAPHVPSDAAVKTEKAEAVTTTANAAKGTAGDTGAAFKTSSASAPVAKVIGNSDSKRYHLPGMKYYHLVDSHHRVEFPSEAEAIQAGYHKAPR